MIKVVWFVVCLSGVNSISLLRSYFLMVFSVYNSLLCAFGLITGVYSFSSSFGVVGPDAILVILSSNSVSKSSVGRSRFFIVC